MILIGVVLVGISGFSSYAIFTSEVTSPNEIRGVVVENKKSLVDIIKSREGQDGLRKIEQEATTQMTATTEYRYSGNNDSVNNYINFNNETWRIIGVFEVEDENGKKEERVKIIREKPLEVIKRYGGSHGRWTYYDNNDSYSYGHLNDAYYNSISENHKKLIAPTKYYLGATGSSYTSATSKDIYAVERGAASSTSYPQNIVTNIGLMYASDYGYAADSSCDTTAIYSFSSGCYDKNWLYTSVYTNGSNYTYTGTSTSSYEWVLTANTYSSTTTVTVYYAYVLQVTNGRLYRTSYSSNYLMRPTLYLKADVIIASGNGMKDNPYELGVKLDKSVANAPVLTENMIPVYYDGVLAKKADIKNEQEEHKWYDYDEKMWANAVTVSDANRNTYINAEPGTVISDINTKWVWIPRYKYTYFASSTPVAISITFEKGTASTGTIKCIDAISANSGKSETCTDTTNGSIVKGTSTYTHPAFTFGDQELTGIWVGKFENSELQGSENSSTALGTPIIVENKKLWRSAVSSLFKSIRNMELKDNIYGFPQTGGSQNAYTGEITGDSNNLDTHLMKNMEWGAVAYLSHSKYGTCTNGTCSEVGINSSEWLWSGCGTVAGQNSSSECNAYYKDLGMKASTTGNISGIYDMSGGLNEYVMANMQDSSNNFYPLKSGTWSSANKPLDKYYDKYSYGTTGTDYTRGKLGDATFEMGPTQASGSIYTYGYGWYNDFASFIVSDKSWLLRGGYYSNATEAGIFHFTSYDGGFENPLYGSRTVLTIDSK